MSLIWSKEQCGQLHNEGVRYGELFSRDRRLISLRTKMDADSELSDRKGKRRQVALRNLDGKYQRRFNRG